MAKLPKKSKVEMKYHDLNNQLWYKEQQKALSTAYNNAISPTTPALDSIIGLDNNALTGKIVPTQIPFTYSLIGDIIQNPISVSILNLQKMCYSDAVSAYCMKNIAIMVASRIDRYKHKNSDIEFLVNYALDNLKGGKSRFFDALTSVPLWAGRSTVYLVPDLYKGKFIFKDFIPLPPSSLIFAVDKYGQLKDYGGIMQYYYNPQGDLSSNWNAYNNYSQVSGDYAYPIRTTVTNMFYLNPFNTNEKDFNRDYLISSVCTGNDGVYTPYGKPIAENNWSNYCQKLGTLQGLQIALTYKSSPLILFYTSPNQVVTNTNDGQVVNLNIADNLRTQLDKLQGNGYLIITGMKGQAVEHEVVDNTANIGDIIDAIRYNDIQTGISFMQGNIDSSNSSFASGSLHTSQFIKYVDYATINLVECLTREFVKPIINNNWRNEEDMGHFTLTEQTLDDKLKTLKLVEGGLAMNLINAKSLTDINQIQASLGYPITDDLFTNPQNIEALNVDGVKRDTKTPYSDNGSMERYADSKLY